MQVTMISKGQGYIDKDIAIKFEGDKIIILKKEVKSNEY